MAEPGRYCLKWNQYQDNFSGTIQDFRKGFEFSDVTLACDDEQIQAHKLILSTSSPLLRTLFHRYNHPNPLVLLRGIRTKDMEAVVDFIYQGEVDVSQENLQGFLSLARDLQIKGLTGGSEKEKMVHSEKNVTNLSVNDSSKEFSDGKLKSNIEMIKGKQVFPNESEGVAAVSDTGVSSDLAPSENV